MDKNFRQVVLDLHEQVTNLCLLYEGMKDLPELVDESNYKVGKIKRGSDVYNVQATLTAIDRLLLYSMVDLNQIQQKISDIVLTLEKLVESKEMRRIGKNNLLFK